MLKSKSLLVVSAASLALTLSACGGETEATPTTPAVPTPSVNVPEGVTLTKAGTRLKVGQKATVAYEANAQKSSVLDLTVLKVQKASISELGSYQLDAQTKTSTPYYVNVQVGNVGDADLGGVAVPLYLVDSTNTLIHSSSFTNRFAPCPSGPLPKSFAPQAKTTTCLVYLVPRGTAYREVSFRPIQKLDPIVWEVPAVNSAAVQRQVAKAKKKASN